MALIDDPQAWILRLFEMEVREGRGKDCVIFIDGARPPGLPLENSERVFGIYKAKYYFTPTALLISQNQQVDRIPWADIRACTSKHGGGNKFSKLTLRNGRTVRVRVGDMATGHSGRISQLFHQMIERYGQLAAMGNSLLPVKQFFDSANDEYCIAPNLEPHPTREAFRTALLQLENAGNGTRLLVDICSEEDESLVANAIVIVTPDPAEHFQKFAEEFRADGVVAADEQTLRRVGAIPAAFKVWHVLWD